MFKSRWSGLISNFAQKVIISSEPIQISSKPMNIFEALAQLRSGYSPFLQSYLHRLDESTPETCPQCNSETHTTGHLFRCSANPTTLTPHALWENPIEAAVFLQLDTEEATNERQEEGQTTGT